MTWAIRERKARDSDFMGGGEGISGTFSRSPHATN